jgi:hypothetical protein
MRSRRSSRSATLAALLAALGIGACGGSGSAQVVARVAGQPITKAKLDRLAAYMAATSENGPHGAALRAQALGSLVSAQWLIAEAARRGLSSSHGELTGETEAIEQRSAVPPADVELQARAELARAKLRALALAAIPKVTRAEVAAYYARHKRLYYLQGRREARFTNRKTRAEIEKVKKEAEAGKSLTSPQQVKVGELFTGASVPPGRGDPYEEAIDSAKPHTVAGPYKIHNDEWLYEVVKVVPAHQQTLEQVARAIARKLTSERSRAALAAFARVLTAQWTARTDCQRGYVAPGCRQYRGGAASGLVRL